MRIARAILVGSIAAFTIQTVAALARSSDAQRTDDKSTPSSCSSYVQNPDGTWMPIPCQPNGSGARTQPKSATHGMDGETR